MPTYNHYFIQNYVANDYNIFTMLNINLIFTENLGEGVVTESIETAPNEVYGITLTSL